MDVCKAHRRKLDEAPDASEASDDNLMRIVKAHKDPEWWRSYAKKPSQLAYVRWWASQCRREARKRGLL